MPSPPELRHADFRRIDLNLLVAFDALVQERHVGKAAARVFVGQPAMSHALARLREALGDELFVRSGNRMEPTALAQQLAPRVRAWLEEACGFLFGRDAVDLRRVQTTLRISTIDGLEPVLVPALMAELRASAPGIRIWTKQLESDELLPALDAQEIDIAIGVGHLPYREWHASEAVARSSFECVYSPEQLVLPDPVTLAALSDYEHVALSWRGASGSEFDRFFAQHGLQRRVAVSAVSQLAIIRILRQFPLVTVQSCLISSIYRDVAGIVVRPIASEMALDVRMVWHRRNERDPAQAHVRQLVSRLLARQAARQGAAGPDAACPAA